MKKTHRAVQKILDRNRAKAEAPNPLTQNTKNKKNDGNKKS